MGSTKTSRSKPSDLVRQYAVRNYLTPARRRRETTVTVNVGTVHKALRLTNRVPLVCTALESKKFLDENQLRVIAKTGPPSGQSTTVTYTFELLSSKAEGSNDEAWNQMRGALKDVYAAFGGGEAYLRAERESFGRDGSKPE